MGALFGLAAGGLCSVVVRQAVFKYKSTPYPILVAGMLAGFIVGANGANVQGTTLRRAVDDREVLKAFDERWARSVLAVSGLLSNHTSAAHNEDNNDFSKPY